MAVRKEPAVSALDVGRHSFGAFLDDFLAKAKVELLRECDRIATSRELLLKKQLTKLRKDNDKLCRQIERITTKVAENTPPVLSRGNDSTQQESLPEEVTVVDMKDSQLDLVDNPDLSSAKQDGEHSDSQLDLVDNPDLSSAKQDGEHSDHHHSDHHLKLWGEWSELDHHDGVVSDVEGGKQVDDENMRSSNLVWDHDMPTPEEHKKGHCVVNPNSEFCIIWEVVGIPILFYDLVTIPMQVFVKPSGWLVDIFAWCVILYWTSDMLLRLFFIGGIDSDGQVLLDRRSFVKMYMKRSFSFDFFMVGPDWFGKIVGASGGMRNVAILRLLRILRLMRLARMTKMKRLFRNLEDAIDSEYFTVAVSLVLNLFAILGLCHYLGCFWFWLGTIEVEGKESWVDKWVKDEDWEYQYVVSLHWAISQFTPGASRIQPLNLVESSGCIVVLIFGLIFLSLFISALAQARARLQALTSKIDRDNWMLRRYLRQQGVSVDLQVRAMRYVENVLEPMFTRLQRKDVLLLGHLSRPLQLEVQEEQYYHTLIAHPLLKRLRDRSMSLTLHLFMNVIIEIMLAQSDLLFEFGSVAHEMYFVSRGSIAYLQHGDNQVKNVDSGQWCAEPVLYVQWVHVGTSKAALESHVISMDSAKLRGAVLEHKEKTYVTQCAQAYFKDLTALQEGGKTISDLTCISLDDSSNYMSAIDGRPNHPVSVQSVTHSL